MTLLFIYAGAGGIDAQDWAGILLNMYEKFFSKNFIGYKKIGLTSGPEAGIKNVTLEVDLDFNKLKAEAGVHRLVRLSPFNAKKLRHTSFALVEVLPVSKNLAIDISDQDLKIDTYRSSGAGGQHVNKTSSAVRITHLPTGVVATCQSERSQLQNRERAREVLRSRLLEKQKAEAEKTQFGFKTGLSAQWGNQTRSYVLHPYKMVKDEKTGKKYSNAEEILAGKLDKLIPIS